MQYILTETEYKDLKDKERIFDEVQLYIKKSSRPHYTKVRNGCGAVMTQFQDGTKLDIDLLKIFEMLGFDFSDGLHIEMRS